MRLRVHILLNLSDGAAILKEFEICFLGHYPICIGWNPINLIEGEGRWIMQVAIFSILAAFFTTILYVIKNRLLISKNYVNNHPVWATIISAFYSPLLVLIWYAMFVYSIDIVSDDLLSDLFFMSYTVVAKVGALITFAWAMLRLKNGIVRLIAKKQIYAKRKIDAPTLNVLSKVATLVIVIVVLIILHDMAGMSMTTFLAFSGVGGLAIAFASQDIIANFFGSLMIHIIRPFVIGEDISVPSSQLDGKVEEIGWYQTRIRSSVDTTTMYMPNSLFSKALVVNKTRLKSRLISEMIYVRLNPELLPSYIEDLRTAIQQNQAVAIDQRISVWISTLYGACAKIGIYAAVSALEYNAFLSVRDEVLIQSVRIARRYGGEVTTPPENHQGWMVPSEEGARNR